MKAANEEKKLNKSNERFKSAQLSKPAPIHAFTGRVIPCPLCANTLRGISQLKMESGKWKVSLDDLLPAQFIYPWKMVLKQLGIFPSPMGEDRISKFVRTLEILGEGRRKVENGKWKIVLKSSLPAQFIYPWKMVLKQSSARHTQSCLSEGVNVSLFGAGLSSLAQDCFITTFKPLINLTLIHLLTSKRKEVNYAKH